MTTKRHRLVRVMLVVGLLVAACASVDVSGPPHIEIGRDMCVECGMIITDGRFATAYRSTEGTDKVFDDVGGMVLHLRNTGDEFAAGAVWVRDFTTETWIEAGEAHFVPTSSVSSPMGHSILAFADVEEAEAFAGDVGADVIDFDTVMALPVTGRLLGTHHDDDPDVESHGMDAHSTDDDHGEGG